jgi:CHAT domain-containing protein/Tfp pilus assembly protein PilF
MRRSHLLISAMICILCCTFADAKPFICRNAAEQTIQPKDISGVLFPGITLDKKISSGEIAVYQIQLEPNAFVRIDLFAMGTDFLATVARPDQKILDRWYVGRSAPQPIAWIADLPGIYRLEICILKGKYANQAYKIGIVTQRKSGLQDQKRVTASKALSSAVYLNRAYSSDALHKAIKKYEEALEIWRFLKDQPQQAFVLCQIGDVYSLISENRKAMKVFTQANLLEGVSEAKARIANSIGELFRRKGENDSAKKFFLEGLEISRSAGNTWWVGKSLYKLGVAHYTMNRHQEAQDYLSKAQTIAELFEDRIGLSDIHLYLGYTLHAQKDLKKAQSHYEQSLQLGRETEEIDEQAAALLALGHLMVTAGELQKAFGLYDEAMDLFKKMGDITNQNGVLQGMAYGFRVMGELQKARELYERSAAISRELNDAYVECQTLLFIAEIYQELNNYDEATRYCERALQANRGVSLNLEASVLATMGKIYEKRGNISKSRAQYAQALELCRKTGDKFLEGLLLNAIGHTYHSNAENQEALKYFHEALLLQKASEDVINKPGTFFNLSQAHRDLGNFDAALKSMDEAIRSTESLRVKVADPDFRASYNASVNDIHKYAIDLLMELDRDRPKSGFDAKALQANERALARSLLESLTEARANIKQGVDGKLLEREHDLQQKLNIKGQEQMALLSKKNTPEQVVALSKEIDDLATEYHEVQELIRGKSPHYAALTQPQPIDVQEIQQQLLDPDTLLLEFSLGAEHSYLWAATQTSLNSYELPSRAEIEKATRKVRDLILASQPQAVAGSADSQSTIKNAETQLAETSAALSRMLFGKAAHLFEKKRLVIVAEGALQYLPFSALPEPPVLKADNAVENQAAPLIANHEIVYEPSASVLFAQRNETRDRPVPPKMIAVFADPVFEKDDPRLQKKQTVEPKTVIVKHRPGPVAPVSYGQQGSPNPISKNALKTDDKLNTHGMLREGLSLSRLPSTRNEAEAILALMPPEMRLKAMDFDASLTTVNNANLSQYRVLHFATHGLLDSEHPELSALVLSLVDEKGRDQNGFLRLSDIYNLDLSAQLVVLSACNTGLGKEVRGEGLVGIVRGFMYAGAPRVIASLWKVEDEATAELMKHFYQHLFEKGEPAAAALRAAQKEISQMKRWKAPYYWAPFVLQGEWK